MQKIISALIDTRIPNFHGVLKEYFENLILLKKLCDEQKVDFQFQERDLTDLQRKTDESNVSINDEIKIILGNINRDIAILEMQLNEDNSELQAIITHIKEIDSRTQVVDQTTYDDSSHSEASSGSRGVLEPPRDFAVGSNGDIGDKLYGNQEHRDTMLPALRTQFVHTQGRDVFTIDEYNEELGIGCAASENIDWPQALEFRTFLEQTGFDYQSEKAVRRACKLGLDFTAQHRRKAHFILSDRVLRNMSAVVNKEGIAGRTITSYELRYIFKHRGTLADSIIFYQKVSSKSEGSSAATKGLERVLPPWDQEKFRELWNLYGLTLE
jgi:hypothetical protein